MKRIVQAAISIIIWLLSIPVIPIWLVAGFCVYSLRELILYLLGKTEAVFHPPGVRCSQTNPCDECRRAKRGMIFLSCIALALIGLVIFWIFWVIEEYGVKNFVLSTLIFFGISWLVLKQASGKS